MIEFAGSSCVGATLRANVRVPPVFGVPAAAAVLVVPDAVPVLLELLLDEPHAASIGPSAASADPLAPFTSNLRRVNTNRSTSKKEPPRATAFDPQQC